MLSDYQVEKVTDGAKENMTDGAKENMTKRRVWYGYVVVQYNSYILPRHVGN